MDDTLSTNHATIIESQPPALPALPAPKGIGMAVAFDWGLSAQLLLGPLLPLVLKSSSAPAPIPGSAALSLLVSLPAAALLALFGEGIRRGWRWTRPVQLVANSLGILGGIFTLFGLYQSSHHGNYWSLITAVILLVFSPLIVWRLSRPETARWFAEVSSSDARRRHGGAWPFLIALWALVGGILQALAVSHR